MHANILQFLQDMIMVPFLTCKSYKVPKNIDTSLERLFHKWTQGRGVFEVPMGLETTWGLGETQVEITSVRGLWGFLRIGRNQVEEVVWVIGGLLAVEEIVKRC